VGVPFHDAPIYGMRELHGSRGNRWRLLRFVLLGEVASDGGSSGLAALGRALLVRAASLLVVMLPVRPVI